METFTSHKTNSDKGIMGHNAENKNAKQNIQYYINCDHNAKYQEPPGK